MEKKIVVMVVVALCLGLSAVCASAKGSVTLCNDEDGVRGITMKEISQGNFTPGDTPGFPLTISESGSYRLCEDITVPDENTTAIQVTADNVTIDLNGFAILGPTVCTGTPLECTPTGNGMGINAYSPNYTKVANGTIRGMGGTGVGANSGSIVQGVRAISNGGEYGIDVGDGTVSGNTANGNGGSGIRLYQDGIVSGNTANGNRSDGIFVETRGFVSGNTTNYNGDDGIDVGSGTVSGNISMQNNGDGIILETFGTVSGNTANNNSGYWGIFIEEGTVSGNTTSYNTGAGIGVDTFAMVSNNTSTRNQGDGIYVVDGMVSGNTSMGNKGYGIDTGAGANTGYFNNGLASNTLGNVNHGLNLGNNLCGTVLCP